ncbi:TrkA C-terminal domain-containing protein [Mobilibacterium timonense]|uniref:TrkA C-terminal domain-containing protein n=1 Tax=Mobilibacterium timonense TaxID=1871012 RepID=UPI0023565259|nr:TrkA C-terminal domain-containing protein [Mobilibacterium timonense]MBM6990465.1 GntR family transcriptional regulator [Mobilibacterium timonense]
MQKTSMPRYQQIAVDIADRIAMGKYGVGTKLSARTDLASSFNTSPETVRRAVNILEDVGAVEIIHGSGVYVLSKEKAKDFIQNHKDVHDSRTTIAALLECVRRQEEELNTLTKLVNDLDIQSRRTYYAFPFSPQEVTIDDDCDCIGVTLGNLQLWNRSGATVIAIRHDSEYNVAPGPDAVITIGDTLYFIGEEEARNKLVHILWPKRKTKKAAREREADARL